MAREKKTSQELLDELREYKPDGTPVHRYWLEPGDKWWDLGAYFHCLVLIGIWMLYDAVTTGYMTKTQFIVDHAITVFWVYCAGIYSFTVVVIDMIDAYKHPSE